MSTLLISLGPLAFGLVIGSLGTFVVQSRLSKLERFHDLLTDLAKTLAVAQGVIDDLHPGRFMWGDPEDWSPRLTEIGERVDAIQEELRVVAHSVPAELVDALEELAFAITANRRELAFTAGAAAIAPTESSSPALVELENRAKEANEAARAARAKASDRVRSRLV